MSFFTKVHQTEVQEVLSNTYIYSCCMHL